MKFTIDIKTAHELTITEQAGLEGRLGSILANNVGYIVGDVVIQMVEVRRGDDAHTAPTEAAEAWRAWVADERSSPLWFDNMDSPNCILCWMSWEDEKHDDGCPYQMMRDELAKE